MGVKGLFELLKPFKNNLDINNLQKTTLVIDFSIILWKVFNAPKISTLTDKNGYKIAHLIYILNLYQRSQRQNIKLIFVFDNVPPKSKQNTIAKRKLKRLGEYPIPKYAVSESKDIISLLGLDYIISPENYEAEFICSKIANYYNGYVLSEDSDCLIFGCDRLLKFKSKTSNFSYYSRSEILKKLGITQKQFVMIALALGTDYIEKTPHVGITSVVEKVKNNKIILTKEQLEFIPYFMESIPKNINVISGEKDLEELKTWLLNKNFSEKYLDSRLLSS